MFSADLGGYTAPLPDATNPPFNKVALLLHGDGTNGAQNNTFVDSSSNNFTITRTGNVAQGTFSPFSLPDGQWSNYFGTTGANLSLPSTINLTGDFTCEAWVYRTANDSNQSLIFTNAGAGFYFGYTSTGGIYIYMGSGQFITTGAGTALTANAWHHFAVTRSGTTVYGFVNGVLIVSGTATANPSLNQIGGYATGFNVLGYLSNVRVVNGTAVYTSNFTPSTAPLTAISGTSLLTCQSNRFKDNSSNNFTITRNGDTRVTAWSPFEPGAPYIPAINGGSGYFDGTGDYLTVPDNAGFKFGSDNFTIECWVYTSTAPAEIDLITKWNAVGGGSSPGQWVLYVASGTPTFVTSQTGSSFSVNITSPNLVLNSWNHLAAVRNGNVFTLYTNGVAGTSATVSGSLYASETEVLGISYRRNNSSTQYPLTGYMGDVRIVKGTAVYTSNFTPPTAPLTAVANTQLLLNCTNAGIYDNAAKNDIETVGNAQISTSVKKYGTGSMAFDGSGDYLSIAASMLPAPLTGDFTIEAWVNAAAISSTVNSTICNIYAGAIRITATTGKFFAFGQVSTTSPSTNTWYHVAVSRSGTTIRLFVNGVLEASGANASSFGSATATIGAGTPGANPLNGYIDDLRVTIGQALYTSNFTPPTQAFPNV